MSNILINLLSVALQATAAIVALRTIRITGRMTAWVLVSVALVLMAARRAYVLVELLRVGPPSRVMPNEVLGLGISVLMLAGVILIRHTFRTLATEQARAVTAGSRARLEVERLAAIMDAAPLPIWIAEDPQCNVIHGNPAASSLLRLPPGANHSRNPFGQPHPASFRLEAHGRALTSEEMPMQRAVATGQLVRDLPLDLVFEDGIRRHVLANATPLRDADGTIAGGVASFVDLTDMQRTEERLRQVMKIESLGLMASGISHDFNNLFQAMVGNLELALAHLPQGSELRPYLDRLQGSLDRAATLSREILHCSGGDLRQPSPLLLSTTVAEVLQDFPGAVAADLGTDLPIIMADPRLVARVAEGIIVNALEAAPPGSPVKVRTYARRLEPEDLAVGFWPEAPPMGPCVALEVEDQGHGIPAESVPRIFDPFFSTRNLGRGLGLAASLGIVRSHGGGIQVESQPGQGSVFRVFFPSREEEVAPAPVPEPARQVTRRLVLLADDEPDLRESLGEILRDWLGFDVEEAKDGEEALERFRQRPEAFDLVLIDATMPRLGGVEAFQAMRGLRPGLRGILCSGYASADARSQAQSQGFADFLKKPFSSAELRQMLDRVIGA